MACLALAGAAPAMADSISYVKDGDVWLTTPDGKRQVRVTTSGAYAEASQADDGTIIALTGESLHKLSPTGKLLASFTTPVSDGPPKEQGNNYFNGPFDPQISPDGTKVAYTYYWQHYTFDYSCDPPRGCYRTRLDSGTAISFSDRNTAWDEFGGPLTGWKWANWLDNERILRSDAGVILNEDTVINRIGAGLGDDDLTRWFRDSSLDHFEQAEMNRQGTLIAAGVKDPDQWWQIRVYRTNGAAPELPEACFAYNSEDGNNEMNSPSFSPSGTALAFEADGGISVATGIPAMPSGCVLPAEGGKTLVPGAHSPDWGPADVPVAGPSKGPETPGGGGSGGGAAAGAIAVKLQPAKLGGALGTGLRVKVAVPGAGVLKATAKRGSKVVASGSPQPQGGRHRDRDPALHEVGQERPALRAQGQAPGDRRLHAHGRQAGQAHARRQPRALAPSLVPPQSPASAACPRGPEAVFHAYHGSERRLCQESSVTRTTRGGDMPFTWRWSAVAHGGDNDAEPGYFYVPGELVVNATDAADAEDAEPDLVGVPAPDGRVDGRDHLHGGHHRRGPGDRRRDPQGEPERARRAAPRAARRPVVRGRARQPPRAVARRLCDSRATARATG